MKNKLQRYKLQLIFFDLKKINLFKCKIGPSYKPLKIGTFFQKFQVCISFFNLTA